MSANRSRSIKEFFKRRESQQEGGNPTLSASSDDEIDRADLSDSNQGRRFYVIDL